MASTHLSTISVVQLCSDCMCPAALAGQGITAAGGDGDTRRTRLSAFFSRREADLLLFAYLDRKHGYYRCAPFERTARILSRVAGLLTIRTVGCVHRRQFWDSALLASGAGISRSGRGVINPGSPLQCDYPPRAGSFCQQNFHDGGVELSIVGGSCVALLGLRCRSGAQNRPVLDHTYVPPGILY